jgi:hypothetical protein
MVEILVATSNRALRRTAHRRPAAHPIGGPLIRVVSPSGGEPCRSLPTTN